MEDTTTSGGDFSSELEAEFSAQESAGTADATSTPETQTDPAATVQAGAADVSTQTSTKQGPIPFDVHHTALENARQKAVAEWEQQYGWAKQVDRAAVEQAVMLAQKYSADKVGLLQELIADAQNDPQAAQQLRSMAARALAQGRQSQPQTTDSGLPNVEITDAQGNVVGTLGQILDQERQRMLAEIRREFEPVTKTVEQVTAERAALKAQHDAHQFATATMQEAASYPGMDAAENRQAVAARIKSYNLTSDDPRDLRMAFDRAWREVVLPKLSQLQRSAVLTDQQHKAAVNTAHPSHQANGAPKSYSNMSFEEAFKHEWAAAQGAR